MLDLSRLRDAQQFYNDDLLAYARDSLESVAPENRCVVWGLMRSVVEGSIYTAYGHVGEPKCVAWSPDGSRILTGGEDKTISVWSAN